MAGGAVVLPEFARKWRARHADAPGASSINRETAVIPAGPEAAAGTVS
jgi:hypothetical protein